MAQMCNSGLQRLVAQSRYDEALREAARRVEAARPGRPHAKALFDLSYALHLVGDHRRAAKRIDEALVAAATAFGEDHPRYAAAIDLAGEIVGGLGNSAAAIERHEAAIAIYQRNQVGGVPLARAWFHLARHLIASDPKRASKLLQRARAELEDLADPISERLLSSVLYVLAQGYAARRKLPEATRFMRRVLALRERRYGAKHVDVAEALRGLADLAAAEGRDAEALADYSRAREIYRQASGQWSDPIAQLTARIADLHARQRRLPEARAEYHSLLAQMGPAHPDAPAVRAVLEEIARALP